MSTATTSQVHRLLPKAPLVFRTGRPLGETGGGDTYPFPLPSTVAGALRTAWAEQQGGFDYRQQQAQLLALPVHGPLLARFNGHEVTALLPRPADALYLPAPQANCTVHAYRLAPQSINDAGCDLPHPGLQPVLPIADELPSGKPPSGLPLFWTTDTMNRWLIGAALPDNTLSHGDVSLPIETRTHVALAGETLAADPGALFQSAGIDFSMRRKSTAGGLEERGWHDEEFGLLVRSGFSLASTQRRVGGEGRCAHIETATGWPVMPQELAQSIVKARRLRLVLATPAVFAGGWRPGWINANTLEGSPPGHQGLQLRLHACVCERWQALSGWDLVERKPRAVRRLVPAGAVYWFEVLEGDAESINRLWLSPLSDRHQDQLDGFGLALPGLWIQAEKACKNGQ